MKLRTKILKKRKRKRRSDFDHLRTDGGGEQMSEEKYLCVIADPNGSGKSSSVEQAFGYYDKIGVKPAYLCPDDVCLQLMKKDPDTDRTNAAVLAKNIVLEKRNEFLEKGISFITETVFCHESHLAFMKKAVDIADTAEIRDNSTEGELAKTCAVKMFGNVYIVSDEHGWVKKYLE